MKNHFIGLSLLLTSVNGCKTNPSNTATIKNEAVTRPSTEAITAQSVLDYEVSTLKRHLANAQSGDLANKVLWSMFLEEPQSDTPCPGKALEAYYLIDGGNDPADKVHLVTAKPMPMNGPCGLALDIEVKPTSEVSRALMESSPLAEIGTFDKIKISIKQAVAKTESHYKTFKYQDGIKIYRHLHPTTWDFPWYAVYGTSCGLDSTAYINAQTGEIMDMIDSPPLGSCPQK